MRRVLAIQHKQRRELEVNSVLAGTYQRVGRVMRVSVQLIDHGAAAGEADMTCKGATCAF